MNGPLAGLRVIEAGGIGPAPFCGMMLADMGAEVVRIDRTGGGDIGAMQYGQPRFAMSHRGKHAITLDLKKPDGIAVVLRMVEQADVLLEGFRPGVTERLGIGPQTALERNPALIYARMTGWGQTGPLAHSAGHDINYIALAGALDAFGTPDQPPVPPLNIVGDNGGGGLLCAFGIVSALWERGRSGQGQVVDAAMVDGVAVLMADYFGGIEGNWFNTVRQSNLLDGAAPFYRAYRTKDDRYIAFGAVEPEFYAILVERLKLPADLFGKQMNEARWPEMSVELARRVAERTLAQLESLFENSDACFAPVLSVREAPDHPHAIARDSFYVSEGVRQPRPAPRFTRTPPATPVPAAFPGSHTHDVLRRWGFSAQEVAQLVVAGAVDPFP